MVSPVPRGLVFSSKNDSTIDFAHHPALGGHLNPNDEKKPLIGEVYEEEEAPTADVATGRPSMHDERSHSRAASYSTNPRTSMNHPRASVDMRPLGRVGTGYGSQIDMSTGARTPGELNVPVQL